MPVSEKKEGLLGENQRGTRMKKLSRFLRAAALCGGIPLLAGGTIVKETPPASAAEAPEQAALPDPALLLDTVPRKKETPQFVHDAKGKRVDPLTTERAPEIKPRPNPVPSPAKSTSASGAERKHADHPNSVRSDPSEERRNRPSPIERTERPTHSTMPTSPFLRPNPLHR